jgi:hypothetical protein
VTSLYGIIFFHQRLENFYVVNKSEEVGGIKNFKVGHETGRKKYFKGSNTNPAERIKKCKMKERRRWFVFSEHSNEYIVAL